MNVGNKPILENIPSILATQLSDWYSGHKEIRRRLENGGPIREFIEVMERSEREAAINLEWLLDELMKENA